MKKAMIVLILALAAMTGMYANGSRDTIVTVEGKIAITDSIPSIVSGDKSWTLPVGAFYQIAWKNGLKVGDAVKAEGRVIERPLATSSATAATATEKILVPTKVWVNGKEIDISDVATGKGMGMMGGAGMRAGNAPLGANCPMVGNSKRGNRSGR